MAKITVDGKVFEVDDSRNLLEALLSLGEDLPYFCWHPEMGSVGACRQCAVVQYMNAEDERGRIVMSCMTPVTDGAIFSVQGEKAATFRTSVVENLMLNHPHDCPVCEEGGECHLQDMTVMTGHRDRHYRFRKQTFENQYLGPFIGHEMNRCITCYRCVRYYQDYAGDHDLAAFASRDRVFFGRFEDGTLQNEFSGNLVEVCPTGVFTDKTLSRHYTRKWDLESAPAICQGCSLGCNVTVSERYGELRRITNRYHGEINGYFLCDRGRFGQQYVNSEHRIRYCGTRADSGVYEARKPDTMLSTLKDRIANAGHIVGIGSARASLEANFALQQLVGTDNYYPGLSRNEAEIGKQLLEVLRSNLHVPSLSEVEQCDAILILGEDTTNHAPRLALAIRQATRNEALQLAREARIPLWQDAAVRKLAQDARSPLFILTPGEDRLDDVGKGCRLHPDQIAAAGYNIAHAISSGFEASIDVPLDVEDIARTLGGAKKPLVVTGSSTGSPEIVRAAINVASALLAEGCEAGLVITTDEVNTLVPVLLANRNPPVPESPADVAIVLENDLTRRFPAEELDRWLEQVGHLVVIDHLDNGTASMSDTILPAATFAEAEGTFINHEGRAQRSFGAFKPGDAIRPSWQWLLDLCHDQGRLDEIEHIDGLLDAIATRIPELAAARDAAPGARFREHGRKVSRMTPRASGRTAMRADISVHEPKQPDDPESPLTYSMEGEGTRVPPALRAFTWYPGWNSNQSINKFQDETGGHLRDGDPGVILFHGASTLPPCTPAEPKSVEVTFVPRWHIFGSEELSDRSPEIHSLAPPPCARMNAAMAGRLAVEDGDAIRLKNHDAPSLMVHLDETVPDGCILGTCLGSTAAWFLVSDELIRDDDFVPPDNGIIASDRSL